MSENLKLDMTVDEALAFAEEWTRGMTLHAGSQGWRVVCLLLGEEVKALREAVREREALSESRLEQMNADRKAFNDMRDELITVKSQLAELRQGGEAVEGFFSYDAENDIWEEVMESHKNADGVVPLYTRPQPAIPPGYVVVKSELFEAVAALVRFAGDWNQGTHAKLYRPVICRLVGEHIASAPAIQPAPDVEHVEDICEAYESGYGHGLKRDGLDGSRTPFADPMQQAAYQYGYECGAEKTGKQAAAPSVPVAEKALPENVKLLLLKAHRQLETEYRQQTRATEAKRVANATCGESPGGASSIALLAESGYISSIGKRNQEVRDEIFAMLAAPADSKEGKP